MNKIFRTLGIAVLVVSLGGCMAHGRGGNEVGGGLIGAAGGGLLGAQFGSGSGKIAMAVLGALAGSALGSHIGRTMDAQDAQYASRTFETAPTGRTVAWSNPDTGQHRVTPYRTYETNTGPCREFTHNVYIGGKSQTAYGTACRQADGSWKITQ